MMTGRYWRNGKSKEDRRKERTLEVLLGNLRVAAGIVEVITNTTCSG